MADADELEGLAVLKALEAQHGLFVERAHHIYSFSHLTVQEYFTARYIVDHAADGALDRLITQRLTDDRWREVFLLTASMLPPEGADTFFAAFQRALDTLIADDEHLLAYGQWATTKATDYAYLKHPALTCATARAAAALMSSLERTHDHDRAVDRDHAFALGLSLEHAFDLPLDRAFASDFTFPLVIDFALSIALSRPCSRQ